MNCIIHGLYLGNRDSTQEAKKNNIDVILSIGVKSYSNDVENLYINVDNDSSINITNELNEVTKYINKHLPSKKILIHCQDGVNRSPSFVLAYLCRYKGYKYTEALDYILSKRDICKFSFRENVKKWLIDINPEYVYTLNELNKQHIKQSIKNSKIKKHNDELVGRWFKHLSNSDDTNCYYKTEEIFKESVNGTLHFENISEIFIWSKYPMVRYVLEEKVVFSKDLLSKEKIKSQQLVIEWLKNKCVCNIITDTVGLGRQFIKGFNGFGVIIKESTSTSIKSNNKN